MEGKLCHAQNGKTDESLMHLGGKTGEATMTLPLDPAMLEAAYEFLTAKGDYGSVLFDATDWKKVEEPLKVLLTTAAEAMEQGFFPAAAKACKQCDYKILCGPGAEKRGEKKKEDINTGNYFKLEDLK